MNPIDLQRVKVKQKCIFILSVPYLFYMFVCLSFLTVHLPYSVQCTFVSTCVRFRFHYVLTEPQNKRTTTTTYNFLRTPITYLCNERSTVITTRLLIYTPVRVCLCTIYMYWTSDIRVIRIRNAFSGFSLVNSNSITQRSLVRVSLGPQHLNISQTTPKFRK